MHGKGISWQPKELQIWISKHPHCLRPISALTWLVFPLRPNHAFCQCFYDVSIMLSWTCLLELCKFVIVCFCINFLSTCLLPFLLQKQVPPLPHKIRSTLEQAFKKKMHSYIKENCNCPAASSVSFSPNASPVQHIKESFHRWWHYRNIKVAMERLLGHPTKPSGQKHNMTLYRGWVGRVLASQYLRSNKMSLQDPQWRVQTAPQGMCIL